MFPLFIVLSMITRVPHSSLPLFTPPPLSLLHSLHFWKAPRRSILPLARHHTLISFLIYRLIIRMSLQCPHWAAGGVIEQHKRHLKEGWIIEPERGVSGELDLGLLSQVSGCYRVASTFALWLTMSTSTSFFTSSTLEAEQASTLIWGKKEKINRRVLEGQVKHQQSLYITEATQF